MNLPQAIGEVDDLAEEVYRGRRKLHELPAHLSVDQAARVRRKAMERLAELPLDIIGSYSMDMAAARCENLIGAVQVPVGVVGPLSIRGACVDPGEVIYAPLATSEGALIASTARGCRAIRDAGGAFARVEDVGMTRAPVFRSEGIEQTHRFLDWVAAHEAEIREIAEGSSRHLRLLDIKPRAISNTIYLRFRFSCGDAMGMNMVTAACDRVIERLIVPATGVRCVALSGNYCTDKKPSAVNFAEGRGQRISAEVTVSREVLERCLKTDAKALCEVQYRKNLLGSIVAGSLGYNAHFANIVAAFFLATGQDAAQVVEGSLGITCIEPRDDGAVYASVHLPDVPLAAIGGGTALGAQREALALLGALPDPMRPGAAVCRLGEILGALVLAGELSILSAMAASHLADAHQRLGRPAARG
jgi:hydroxymethylglutaryl-CoA reductase (NADPH)